MFQLLGLSRFVLVPVLAEWLSAKCVVTLDSAVCNRKSRSVLIELIKSYHHKFNLCSYSDEHAVLVSGMIEWLRERELHCLLTKIIIGKRVIKTITSGYCDKISHVLISVRLESFVDATLNILGAVCSFTNLKSLCMSRLQIRHCGELFSALTRHCNQLQSLEVSQCNHVHASSIFKLCRSNPDLRRLSVDLDTNYWPFVMMLLVHCRKIEAPIFNAARQFSAVLCNVFILHAPCLTSLNDCGASTHLLIPYRGGQLVSLALVMEPQQRLNLRQHCPQLTDLKIANVRIPGRVLDALPFGLRVLNLPFHVTNTEDLQAVGQSCEQLESLSVNVGDVSLSCLDCFSALLSLSLHCRGSMVAILQSVAKHCKRLTALDIQNELNDAAQLSAILQSCSQLIYLDIEMGSPLICDAVANYGVRLQTLKLHGLLKQAVGRMIRVLKSCGELRTLHCTDSSAVRSLLPHIAAHCSSHLTELNLKCSGFPVCTLAEYLLKLPRLSVLMASLDDSEVKQIQARRPDLCIFPEFS